MFLFAPLSSSPCFSDSIVGHLHVIHYFRINLFQHVASIGHSPDIYSDVVVSSGCSEIFAHLHRLLSGQSALVWALKMWQFLQKMSTPSSTSCSLDICSGVDISMIWREISALEFGAPPSSPSLTLVHRGASQTFFQFSFLTASEWYFAYSDDKSSSRQHQLGWWALVLLCYSQLKLPGFRQLLALYRPPLQPPVPNPCPYTMYGQLYWVSAQHSQWSLQNLQMMKCLYLI